MQYFRDHFLHDMRHLELGIAGAVMKRKGDALGLTPYFLQPRDSCKAPAVRGKRRHADCSCRVPRRALTKALPLAPPCRREHLRAVDILHRVEEARRKQPQKILPSFRHEPDPLSDRPFMAEGAAFLVRCATPASGLRFPACPVFKARQNLPHGFGLWSSTDTSEQRGPLRRSAWPGKKPYRSKKAPESDSFLSEKAVTPPQDCEGRQVIGGAGTSDGRPGLVRPALLRVAKAEQAAQPSFGAATLPSLVDSIDKRQEATSRSAPRQV
eukprot:scaffold1023_cov313-Pinguiococcus_pyrenoidosus.AAC.5